jgi:hypothetical protein
LRRLSSTTATKEEVSLGRPVVTERMMRQNPDAHSGFAESMEIARDELAAMKLENESPTGAASPQETLSSSITPPDSITTVDSFVFAFDIDGILVRGGQPIPEAIEAMRVLNGENRYCLKV